MEDGEWDKQIEKDIGRRRDERNGKRTEKTTCTS